MAVSPEVAVLYERLIPPPLLPKIPTESTQNRLGLDQIKPLPAKIDTITAPGIFPFLLGT